MVHNLLVNSNAEKSLFLTVVHLIQLYWNAPNDNSEDSQYEYEYYGSLGSIEEILAQHGGKLYG